MFCDHDWELVKDKMLESGAEQVLQNGGTTTGAKVPQWMFEKKSITILKCVKCGKLDKTIEKTYH